MFLINITKLYDKWCIYKFQDKAFLTKEGNFISYAVLIKEHKSNVAFNSRREAISTLKKYCKARERYIRSYGMELFKCEEKNEN